MTPKDYYLRKMQAIISHLTEQQLKTQLEEISNMSTDLGDKLASFDLANKYSNPELDFSTVVLNQLSVAERNALFNNQAYQNYIENLQNPS